MKRRNFLKLFGYGTAAAMTAVPLQAQKYDYSKGYVEMPVGEVEEEARKAGATVKWVDGTVVDRRCPACLVAIAVLIIVGAIWYAACKAKKHERQLPPE